MKNPIFSSKAEKELLAAWIWYEEQQPGLGDRFSNEIQRKVNFLIKNPLHYPLKGRHHEARVEVFPFIVIYAVETNSDIIKIISIFHTSRHPKRKETK
jgi:plasmid stabilization system protein ParE